MTQLSKYIKIVELGDTSAIVYTGKNGGTQKILFDSTGIDIDGTDIGGAVTPVARTNNPTVAANNLTDNVDALDTAIGTDAQIVPLVRTVGPVVVDSTIHQKFDALDTAIGADAEMSGSPTTISTASTVYANLEALSTEKSVRTLRYRIGGVGVANCDFNFTSAANTTEQTIDLGEILPAKCRILDVMTFTNATFTGATTLVADVGLTTGAGDLIASATVYAADAIIAVANNAAGITAPIATAQHVWVNAIPGSNWSAVTAGTLDVYVTYIDVTNL